MTSPLSKEPRRFAPLGQKGEDAAKELPKLKGIVFDVDGTLCLQQNYMFGEMRRALGIDKSTDILDHCHSLPPAEEKEALEKIRNIERTAMTKQEPQPGLVPLMEYLESRNLKKGICTRNFDVPVNHLLGKFLPGKEFHPVITRDFRPPKPSPAGILHIAKSWGIVKDGEGGEKLGDASNMIMVGDSIDDMTAGFSAKAATVLLVTEANAHLAKHEHTDLVVSRLDELIEILEDGFVGQIGREDEESDARKRAEEVLKEGRAEGTTVN
ncbi:related to HAD superfamily hydrolase [Phialocephala subalpina]|uniref:Related to HAD superfamily hydrolase n=1 Tax=Phialocephala subalpina TaxID=576137 RepID=A0A1L7X5T1_9HELO|nr:related to HAD superfamily hydrolase [Phialocephala subalpina]